MIFQKKPLPEDQFCMEVTSTSGQLLGTSPFFTEGWQCLAAATCIFQGKPTVTVQPDGEDRWMFKINAGTGSPTVPEGAILLTSERYPSQAEAEAGARGFMAEAKATGSDAPAVVLS